MAHVLQAARGSVTSVALQDTLTELIDLSLQAKQAHWNVIGPNFRPLHEMLDDFVARYRDWYDEAAERLAAIGVAPDGRAATVAAASSLEPLPAGPLEDRVVVPLIEERLSTVTRRVRERTKEIGEDDLVSQDLLIGIVHGLEKQGWMLRAQRS